MNHQARIWLSITATLLSACSTTPPPAPVAAPAPVVSAVQPKAPPPATPQVVIPPKAAIPAHLDPASAIYKNRSVYFDLDSYVVKPDYSGLIVQHGKYLQANPALSVKIEGNSDERGSSEYNLALGQKRAEAVRRALKLYGVRDSQMEAISFGKEKPKAKAHEESAWAENRRVDIEYPRR